MILEKDLKGESEIILLGMVLFAIQENGVMDSFFLQKVEILLSPYMQKEAEELCFESRDLVTDVEAFTLLLRHVQLLLRSICSEMMIVALPA